MAIEQQSTNSPIEEGELHKEDVIDILNQDDNDDDEPIKTVDSEDDIPEETDDDGKPIKKEETIKIKDGEDEELETSTEEKFSLTPAKRAEILKQFPEFFKKFPEMERSYYRDREYTEIFSTPAEAKEASQRAETLGTFEQQLANGELKGVLGEIKANAPEAFNRIADDYLKAIGEVDPAAQVHVTSGIIKGLVVSLWNEASAQDNDELKKVALAINQFCFGTSNFKPHTALAGPPKNNEVEQERQQFVQERYNITVQDLDKRVSSVLRNTIAQHIDPKNLMGDWVKNNAVKEALDATFNAIKTDTVFKSQLDKLWKHAVDRKFDAQSVAAIRKAYLNKSETVVGGHIKTARNNALKGLGKRVKEEKPEETRIEKPRQSSSSTTRGQKSGKEHKGSTLDFLNQE